MIPLRSPRLSQPLGGVPFANSSLTAGLQSAVFGDGILVMHGKIIAPTAKGGTKRGTKYGVALGNWASTSNQIDLPVGALGNSGSTRLILYVGGSGTSQSISGTGASGYQLRQNNSDIQIVVSGISVTTTFSSAIATGEEACFVVIAADFDLRLYKNGALFSAVVGTAFSGLASTTSGQIGANGAGSQRGSGYVALHLSWNRVLSEKEIASVSQNPWQVFAPVSRRIYTPTAGGTQTLAPGLFSNTNSLYAPAVAPGTAALTPSLFSNTNSFYAPTATAGAVSVEPPLYSNSQAFYAATVAAGAVTLTPSRFDNAASFYGPVVTPGTVSVTPPLVTNAQAFYGSTVTQGGIVLQPARLDNTQTFYGPVVSAGAVTVSPPRLNNAATFYGPAVAATYGLAQASRFDNTNVLYAPIVVVGGAALLPPMLQNANTIYAARVVNDGAFRPIDSDYQTIDIDPAYSVADIDAGYNVLPIDPNYWPN